MLRIRLSRHGAKKNPHYRVVISEKRDPRDGRFVEVVGNYSPAMKPKRLKLNMERIEYWLGVGARPSETVAALIDKARTAQAEAEAEPEAKAETSAEKADSNEKGSKAKESAKEEKKEAKAAEEEKSEPETKQEDEPEAEKENAEA